MKQLAEFDTLEQAKIHPEVRGSLIHRNSMNAMLAAKGWYIKLKDIADNPLHPLRDAVAAFMDSTEYNLIQTSATGQAIIGMMTALIQYEGNDEDLASVRDAAIAKANEVYYPYAKATTHEFMKAKGTCPVKAVEPVNGWLKITLTQGVGAHRPQVYADIQGIRQRVTGFGVVEKTGDYLAEVPRGHSILYVDDAYGTIA